jgi:AraC-like DNA-binding protein
MAPTEFQKVDAANDAAFDVVYADTLRFFPELVRELGGDADQLVREAGIEPGRLSSGQPAGFRLIAHLMEYAAARLQCPDFGMRLAALQGDGSVFGELGVVMRNSSTFGAGLRYVVEHCYAHSLAARVHIERLHNEHRVFVRHDVLLDRLPVMRQTIEQFLLLGHLNALASTGGQARAREVWFRFQALSSRSTYQRHFGCAVRFDQPADGLVFSDDDLDCPTIKPNAQLYAKATSFIRTQFIHVIPPIRAQVRAVVLQWIESADCSKERVAAELHMHPRTLHRRMQAVGTSFEKVKDEVRRDMALGYLSATALSLQRIAEKVGYTEHSVLTRSCSRWFAASPREVRRHLTDGDLRSQRALSPPVVLNCRDGQGALGESQRDTTPDGEASET